MQSILQLVQVVMTVAKAESTDHNGFDSFDMLTTDDAESSSRTPKQNVDRLRTLRRRRVALDRTEFMSLFASPPCSLEGCTMLVAPGEPLPVRFPFVCGVSSASYQPPQSLSLSRGGSEWNLRLSRQSQCGHARTKGGSEWLHSETHKLARCCTHKSQLALWGVVPSSCRVVLPRPPIEGV